MKEKEEKEKDGAERLSKRREAGGGSASNFT